MRILAGIVLTLLFGSVAAFAVAVLFWAAVWTQVT